MHTEGCEEGIDIGRVELVVAFGQPVAAEVAVGSPDRLGDGAEVLLGMEAVEDLDGAGEQLGGELPDPRGAIAEDDAAAGAEKAAPLGLALDAPSEVG